MEKKLLKNQRRNTVIDLYLYPIVIFRELNLKFPKVVCEQRGDERVEVRSCPKRRSKDLNDTNENGGSEIFTSKKTTLKRRQEW